MRVRSVGLRNLLSHNDTEFDLPPTGIVVVTGDNGAGKSSLVEAVAVACWGKTLRGAPAWRDGEVSEAWCAVDSLIVTRRKAKDSPSLEWEDPGHSGNAPGATSAEYTTTTKAQVALEAMLGSFDAWRRRCVFSSSDAAHFSLATDAERKRLLEALFVPGRFDPALVACRADLKAANRAATAAGAKLARLRGELAQAERSLRQAKAALESLGAKPVSKVDANVDAVDLANLTSSVKSCDADIRSTRQKLRGLAESAGGISGELKGVQGQLAIVEEEACPTCGQDISPTVRDAVRQTVTELEERLRTAREGAAKERIGLEADLAELEEERAELAADLEAQRAFEAEKAAQARTARLWQRQHDLHNETVEESAKEIGVLKGHVEAGEVDLDAAEHEVAILKATETVLGLKGVRAQVLGKSLVGLEVVANTWLSKLGRPDLALKARPYKTNKGGGVNDAISLEIEGAGGGYGYKAASGGERRRLDVAILLGLAEVTAGPAAEGDTLWFDEVFDALDSSGREHVARALSALAASRCVVVVTHSEELVEALGSALRVRVVDGELVGLG